MTLHVFTSIYTKFSRFLFSTQLNDDFEFDDTATTVSLARYVCGVNMYGIYLKHFSI